MTMLLWFYQRQMRENYSRRFSIRYPNEELTAGWPLATTPIYDRLSAASIPEHLTLEMPLWFAPAG